MKTVLDPFRNIAGHIEYGNAVAHPIKNSLELRSIPFGRTGKITKALEQLKSFHPDLIGVSAGFDCYARDPLAQETLEAEDFHWLGESLRKTGIPFFSVLEGGYSSHLPELIYAYLKGVASEPRA